MIQPRLIALDLDGTLLNSKKKLSVSNDAALRHASAQGAEIVIATGRFFDALPQTLRALPYVRYYLTSNGAEVYDRLENRVLYRAELPWRQAVEIMEFFDTLPVIYDCYMDNAAWMSAAMKQRINCFSVNEFYRAMLDRLRHPVPELKAFLRQTRHGVQKTMCLFRDMALRAELLKSMQGQFPDTAVTSSIPNNIEITHKDATKGAALTALASQLGIDMAETAAFGDDLNDVSMLRAAGVGIAMGNASEALKAEADLICGDCNRDGVANQLFSLFPDS